MWYKGIYGKLEIVITSISKLLLSNLTSEPRLKSKYQRWLQTVEKVVFLILDSLRKERQTALNEYHFHMDGLHSR